jgi:hypothetical protein
MNSRNFMNNPKKLMAVGMSCLVIAIAMGWFFHPATQFPLDASHALRGTFLGISIVLNFQSARLAGRQRHCRAS